jgi:hypothetical protein
MFMKTFHVARRSPSHPETIRYHVDLEIASMSGTGKTVPLATLEAETIEEATAAVHERYGSAFFPIEVNETTIPPSRHRARFVQPGEHRRRTRYGNVAGNGIPGEQLASGRNGEGKRCRALPLLDRLSVLAQVERAFKTNALNIPT